MESSVTGCTRKFVHLYISITVFTGLIWSSQCRCVSLGYSKAIQALWSPLCKIRTRVRQVRHWLQAQNLRRYQKKKSPSVIQINNTLRQCLNIKIYAKKSMMKKIPELEFYTHVLVTSRCIRIRIHIPDCFPELQIHISICPRGIAGWSSSRTKSSMAKPRS